MRLSNTTDILRHSKLMHPLLKENPGFASIIVRLLTYFRHVQPELVNHSTGAFAEEALQATLSAMIHF